MEVASPANRWEIPSWVPPRVQYFISLIHFTASPGRSRAPAPQTKNRPWHLVWFFKGFEPPTRSFAVILSEGGGGEGKEAWSGPTTSCKIKSVPDQVGGPGCFYQGLVSRVLNMDGRG